MKILLVDDDLDQLSIRAMLLEKSGLEVVKATDAKQARELAAEHRPDCVLMDLNLPTYDEGLALIHDLKATGANLRICILTGSDPQKFRQHPEAKLVDAIFGKPASSAALIRKLKSYA